MADRNPILKPVTDPSVQFEPAVQQQAIQDIVINGTAGGGGGTATVAASDIKKGEVTAYDLTLRTGTATIDGASTAFRDGTMRNLANGDNIVLNKLANDAKDWVSVGVLKPSSGSGTGPTYIAPTINVGFPIDGSALTYPITGPQWISLDDTNGLGFGTNTVYGQVITNTAVRPYNGPHRNHNATTGITTSIPNTTISSYSSNVIVHGSYMYARGGAYRWSLATGWQSINTTTNAYVSPAATVSNFFFAGVTNGYLWIYQTLSTTGGLYAINTSGTITKVFSNIAGPQYPLNVVADNGYVWWTWTGGTNNGTYTCAATVAFPTATGNNLTYRVSSSNLIGSSGDVETWLRIAVDTSGNAWTLGSFGGAQSIIKTFTGGTQQTYPYIFSTTGLAADGEPITSVSNLGVYVYGVRHLRYIGTSLVVGGAVRGSYISKLNTTYPYPAMWQTNGTTTTLIRSGDEYTPPGVGTFQNIQAGCYGPIAYTGTDSVWADNVSSFNLAGSAYTNHLDKLYRGTI